MWVDLKSFVALCRCQNNKEVNGAIGSYAATIPMAIERRCYFTLFDVICRYLTLYDVI